jgi:hypothetical protein
MSLYNRTALTIGILHYRHLPNLILRDPYERALTILEIYKARRKRITITADDAKIRAIIPFAKSNTPDPSPLLRFARGFVRVFKTLHL